MANKLITPKQMVKDCLKIEARECRKRGLEPGSVWKAVTEEWSRRIEEEAERGAIRG